MSQKKILINVFHPNLDQSRGNTALLDAVRDLPGVTIRNLYAEYPDFKIDVKKEQALLVENDIIVQQHPMYWFSSPSLFKEWQDQVLQPGFAFPPGVGDKLAGKVWQSVLTLGGNDVQYTAEGGLGCTVDELLLPFEKTAVYCSMQWRAPFNVYGVIVEEMPGYKMITDEDLAARCQAFRKLLEDYK